MYRQYQNPRQLEKELARKRAEYDQFLLKNEPRMTTGHPDAEALWETARSHHDDIEELLQQVNFAWQDEFQELAS